MNQATIHRWVRVTEVMDYLRLGWLALPTLDGTPHGRWSVHVCWLCECDPIKPRECVREYPFE